MVVLLVFVGALFATCCDWLLLCGNLVFSCGFSVDDFAV